MAGTLSFRAVAAGRQIEVRRDADVSDDLWRRVRAEWGQSGSQPSVAIEVPVEVFASRHRWLPDACRTHAAAVALDELSRSVVRRSRAERRRLQELIADATDAEDLAARLTGSRLTRRLRDFQARDAQRLLSLDHGANFSVPGAGKTTVELAVYEAERVAGRVARLLVVAPLSAFEAWVEETDACLSEPLPVIHRFAGGPVPADAEIVLVNYQRLFGAFDVLARWVQQRPTLVVLDEAHRMKRGRGGEWGTACLDLAFLAERRDILTGTPAPQHPSDLVALFDYVWPGQAQRILPSAALVAQPTPSEVALVTPAIRPLFVRTTKRELELAEPTKIVVPVALEGLHRDIYRTLADQFSRAALGQRDRVDFAAWADVIMYMLEAATNPALLPAGSSSGDPLEFGHPPLPIPEGSTLRELIADYAAFETPAKFVQLAALVDRLRADRRKVLVWSNFVRNLETLERMLAVHEPAVVHGGIPSVVSQPAAARSREHELARFRSDPRCGVLLANPAAMGEGVSLHQVCNDAIYLDRTFNAGQYLQSVDRIHRLGLDPDVETRIHLMVGVDTIDEAVATRIEVKARNLGAMLDDDSVATMALPDEEDVGQPIDVGDRADIEALFANLRGEAHAP